MNRAIISATHSIIATTIAITIGVPFTGGADGIYTLLMFALGLPGSLIFFIILSITLEHQLFLSLANLASVKGEWAAVFGTLKICGITGIALSVFIASIFKPIIEKAEQYKPPNLKYSSDPEADRQIAWIIKMYEHGSSSEGISATLNSNQERYLLDNSEWSKEKVDLVVNEFRKKPKLPN